MDTEQQKEQATTWFTQLRDQICDEFEKIETELSDSANIGKFKRTKWHRQGNKENNTDENCGGGTMSIMHGSVFEKVGVNISTVYGEFSEEFKKKIPGTDKNGKFWASGISLVAHMNSPLVPAVHMNTRYIITDKSWFGGGADLTPVFENENDTNSFHTSLKDACDRHDIDYYPKFKKWCDEYFYLPHRNEARGIGGIFYDNLDTKNWENDFNFTKDIGKTFLDTFPKIVRNHMHKNWTEEQKEQQLIKRGRYVEFNLLHDRGTAFGLQTGGNTEAILMSLPPNVKWP